jgi:hypothetical protein
MFNKTEILQIIQNINNFKPIYLSVSTIQLTYNGKKIVYCTGHKTPKKDGYFVKIYKRDYRNKIAPLNENDLDYMLINLNDNEYLVFSVHVLLEGNILHKLAFRCYSSNCAVKNLNAKYNKEWQSQYLIK